MVTIAVSTASGWAASSKWLTGDGNWSDASMWDNGVPGAVNTGYEKAGVTVAGSAAVDMDLTGGYALESIYQQVHASGNTIVSDGYELHTAAMTLALYVGGSSGFTLKNGAALYNSGSLAMSVPSYGRTGDTTLLVNNSSAHVLTTTRLLNNGRLADQSSDSAMTIRLYQLGEFYTRDELTIHCESGIGKSGTVITNAGVLQFGGWNYLHYGTMTVGQAYDVDAGAWSTNLAATVNLTDGAVLQVDKTAYEPAADYTRTLIHTVANSEWNGSFERILLNGQEVSFGQRISIDTYSQGDTANVWYYRLLKTAADADGVQNDVVLEVADMALRYHSLFQDHMVLQRDMDVPVWGWAAPGASVSLFLDDVPVGEAVADALDGKWTVTMAPRAADGGVPHTLRISSAGEADVLLEDVVFGDVYLASGQSNMLRQMAYAAGFEAEAAASDCPLIRQVEIDRVNSDVVWEEPQIDSPWSLSHPDVIAGFSAVAYFFQRNLVAETGVPVGVIVAAYGGQNIERFLSPEGLRLVPDLSGLRQDVEQGGLEEKLFFDLYNSMIAPLSPYAMRGILWYQGESNGNAADLYRLDLQALIRGWREKWGRDDLTFYLAQLANYGGTAADWPGLRDAQRGILAEENTGMAVLIDIGDDNDIHPANKQDVGFRLAQWALAKEFGINTVYSGPLIYQSSVEGPAIRILFDYAEHGLIVGRKDGTNAVEEVAGGPLENFEIAGSDLVFTHAAAWIDADTVIVSNAAVPSPRYVRYCCANAPSGSNKLYNADGLPASPFRTDQSFWLHVKSGSGTQRVAPGTQVQVTAATPPGGQVFDRWIGAASEIDDPNAALAVITMPERCVYLLATYRDAGAPVYTLTVNSGFGGGTSKPGSILKIEAEAPPAGQQFDHWEGDTGILVDASASSTTLRMPVGNVEVTAVYRMIDSLGDGIPDIWRNTCFPAGGLESAAGSDPDGDGQSNFMEYLAGTSPVDADSVFRLEKTGLTESAIRLSFSSGQLKRYRLERSRSLLSPSWEPVVFNIAGDGFQKNIRADTSPEGVGFFRLNASDK